MIQMKSKNGGRRDSEVSIHKYNLFCKFKAVFASVKIILMVS